jgi:hypothetical protein
VPRRRLGSAEAAVHLVGLFYDSSYASVSPARDAYGSRHSRPKTDVAVPFFAYSILQLKLHIPYGAGEDAGCISESSAKLVTVFYLVTFSEGYGKLVLDQAAVIRDICLRIRARSNATSRTGGIFLRSTRVKTTR